MPNLDQEKLAHFVKNFYAKVNQDPLLGPIFNDIAEVNWDEHIPKLCSFWNSIMLGTNEYKGNAMIKHLDLNKKVALTPKHFERWLYLFEQEAHIALPGDAAQLIIERAHIIADNIQRRVTAAST